MKIMSEQEVANFLNQKDYDVRKSNNARWIDQKCTPDVCCIIADCILNFVSESGKTSFTSRDVWFSNYSVQNVQSIFRKVDVESESATSEYDKFFQQPMKLFAYAGILNETKNGRENIFTIADSEILSYIALAERYALKFLQLYIEKVLNDSGLLTVFNDFYKSPNKANFEKVKEGFYQFTIKYTSIGSRTSKFNSSDRPSYTECGRIFTKIINPLAFKNNSYGTERGHLSRRRITYDMLMYNRDNFRDIYSEKPRDMARRDYERSIDFKPNVRFFAYQSAKAKQFIKVYNLQFRNGLSEVLDGQELSAPATHRHHIFPESEFPTISYYYENIIALTPNQHLVNAHPMGRTNAIDTHYQHQCLVAKADRIKENIETSSLETIYSFGKFLFVINVGLNDESYLQVEDGDYTGVKAKLAASYA